ncbi:protein kinase domain-containing protein [Georgenia sp. Z1491]|uniref:serine/threonine-protein kinase n=1 Tax=Georgenia sp. Z1491 TaxID=3416707 RepID=UPI003CF7149F
MSGRPLGSRYTLDREIGRGAVGSVWRGHRTDDGTVVAIKRLRAEVAEDLEIVRRFIQERTLLTNVVHPNVVRVLDLVAEGSTLAIVMELVDGGDLRQEIDRRGTLTPADTAAYGAGVARGLAAIHDGGVVHRDVKPANILLERTEHEVVPKVTDFGVARVTHGEITEATSATMVVGTPLYMAPEVIHERTPTPASDVYSFGILLYRMLTGITPFTGDGGTYGVMRRQTEMMPGRPDGLPDELWHVIERTLAKEPGSRPDAARLADELDGLVAPLADLPARTRLVHPPTGTPSSGSRPSGAPSPGTDLARTSSASGMREPVPEDADEATVLREPSGSVPAAATRLPVRGTVVQAPDDAPVRSRRRLVMPAVLALVVVAIVALGAVWLTRYLDEPEPGPTPNLWGMTLEEAEEELGDVDVVVEDGLADSHEVGTVMSQSPRRDEQHDGEVEVTIARESARRGVEDLDPLTGEEYSGFEEEAVDIGDDSFLHGVTSEPGEPSGSWGWDLDSGFHVFSATLGRWPASFSDPEEQERFESRVVAVEVTGDGEILWSGSVTVDEPRNVTLDVEGVDELVISWSLTSGGDSTSAAFAVGDGRVLTPPGELPARYGDG